MNIQKFTQKSVEAINDCEKLAYEYGNQQIEQAHLLLALLEGRDMYGYEMIEALRARSNEVFRLKAGTLYPLLHSLEAQGWVTSSDGVANGRTRRYYAITRDGRAALAEQQAGWYAYADAVRGVLEGGNPCGA